MTTLIQSITAALPANSGPPPNTAGPVPVVGGGGSTGGSTGGAQFPPPKPATCLAIGNDCTRNTECCSQNCNASTGVCALGR